MNALATQLLNEALTLEPDERSALAVALLDSVDGIDEGSAARRWADEIRTRKADLRNGVSTAVPWALARARLNDL